MNLDFTPEENAFREEVRAFIAENYPKELRRKQEAGEPLGKDDYLSWHMAISAFRDRLVGHFMGMTGDAVAKARAEFGGLAAAIDALNREGRLAPIEPPKMTALGEFVATYHIGDPSDVSDSWRLGRRRERLTRAAREIAEARRARLQPRSP